MKLGTTGALRPERGFSRAPTPRGFPDHITFWRSHDGILVTSQLSDMQLPGAPKGQAGPTWLLSVSRNGNRPNDDDMRRVIEAFDIPAHDEDNHHPGITRSLFCPIEERYRNACECKLHETVVVEPDGYTWTNPIEGRCRGCELGDMQRSMGAAVTPCPIHAGTAPAREAP